MLRPTRPLRRSADLSRRSSQGSQVASNTAVPPASDTRDNANSAFSAADGKPVYQSTTTLPFLRPCLTTPLKNRTFGAAEPPGKRASRCVTTAELADAPSCTGTRESGLMRHDDGAAVCFAATPPSAPEPLAAQMSGADGSVLHQRGLLPAATQRLFTSDEIAQLRVEARLEYSRGRRLQERKDVIHEEGQERRLLIEDAMSQAQALRDWEKERFAALLRAKSAEALPLQLLELRIQARLTHDYAREDAEQRREGRAAWIDQVAEMKATVTKTETSAVDRRAASHRFRAAVTFVVVQEHNIRTSLEEEAARHWTAFFQAEETSKAEAAQRALVRFLNTPEQLAITAAREQRERRQAKIFAKQRKLFEEQQEKFTKGCHHATGGVSVFEGDPPKKICGRCRVKWDEKLGYLVPLDRTTKSHPPPLPLPSASVTDAKQHAHAGAVATGSKGFAAVNKAKR
ncbi:hypothetical protein ABB37_03142 [Leptomonas pyrrhocoris]|uniref:Uncharacterized protein n=1 Tax=Leptomonas pyrrhocoris TaxID=157538 RepID=A0A0M9G4A0_LEPPY|nr:hypothetical protein ABB37_03142 [Leptomonas pyrrhocoris]XP_015660393.1 hypothetical protein ABB37_03142 [Leptomonas pyrrhocoris]KPA81953.1 hypothetical protein ABB37_03142 [Leptomonas pyrrhocoris]KPA81954.1 hypothetical protein ABB37_03142 [Leptomonas pyrrhocoris]|eukprot:XP_015660392.1 hypothetical protein ABB37_03142 [Leptomonas pyrrhocoris]